MKKLRKWVKITLTIILIALSVIIYSNVNSWGALALSSEFYKLISIISWAWLTVGQVIDYTNIWN